MCSSTVQASTLQWTTRRAGCWTWSARLLTRDMASLLSFCARLRWVREVQQLLTHQPYLLLNPLLAPHTARLVSLIRTRAIKQYITPFSSVRISAMAQAFGSTEDEILAEVASLAEAGDLKVKIDLIDRILTIKDKDARADAFRSALDVGAKANAVTQASTLRMRLIEAGIVVDPAPRDFDEGDVPRASGWDFGGIGGGSSGGGAGRSTRSRLGGFGQALGSLARKAKA